MSSFLIRSERGCPAPRRASSSRMRAKETGVLDRPPPSGAAWCGSTATRQRREPQALCAAKRGCGSGPETGLDSKYPRDGDDA